MLISCRHQDKSDCRHSRKVDTGSRTRARLLLATLLATVTVLALTTACTKPFPTDAALRSYFSTRPGTKAVAVFDAVTGVTYAYGPQTRFRTASTIKVAILGALLTHAQGAHRPLNTFEGRLVSEMMLASQMIDYSDNSATDILYSEIGRGPGLARFMSQVGMSSTVPGPGVYWINTETTVIDMVQLMRAVAYRNTVLTDASRAYMLALMGNVTVSQRWGVSAAVAKGEQVALKNGWMIVPNGWGINSIGRIWGAGHDYVIAVLTVGSPTKSTGVTTVEGTARIATRDL